MIKSSLVGIYIRDGSIFYLFIILGMICVDYKSMNYYDHMIHALCQI